MPTIYVFSDSVGETAEMLARAAVCQFDEEQFNIIRIPYLNGKDQIEACILEASKTNCLIFYTIVSPELRESLRQQAERHNIPAVDVMGPLMNSIQSATNMTPKLKAGLMHRLDQEYFKRIDAVEFAVKYDDGKNPWGIMKADVVIIGVSRTSKTPLSMYLAMKQVKVVNIPLVPGVALPEQVFEVPKEKVVGLIVDPSRLNDIRTERLRSMGLATNTNYANPDNIVEELAYAKEVMDKIGCVVIDVSGKAIEETASLILDIARKNKQK